jgi:DNA-binding protein H-NS
MADGRSISDLKNQLASLTAELESRQKNIRHELKAEFDARLADADLTIADLYPELSKAGKGKKAAGAGTREAVAAKYRNPNGSETWSGRGKPPRWVVEIMDASGLTIEAFKASDAYKA